jgi:hypothetical protein
MLDPTDVTFTVQNGEDTWLLAFSSDMLAGSPPLAAGTYPDAGVVGSLSSQPGLGLVGPKGVLLCAWNGQFQIEAMSGEYAVSAFTATFEPSCAVPGLALRGCVHYAQ